MRTDDLIINGEHADLGTTNVALEFVNNLLTPVDKISTSHTWTITLPRTTRNDRIFGFASRLGVEGAKLNVVMPAEYYRRGVVVVADGRLYCSGVTSAGYQCVLLWSIYPVLQSWLDSKPSLRDLVLSGSGYTWSGTQTSGDLWPEDVAYEAAYDTGVPSMPPTPCANARKIFDAVLDSMGGVTIDASAITSELGYGLSHYAIPLTPRIGGMSGANSGAVKAYDVRKDGSTSLPEVRVETSIGAPPVSAATHYIQCDSEKFTRYDFSISGNLVLGTNIAASSATKLLICGIERDGLNTRTPLASFPVTASNTSSGTTITVSGSYTLESLSDYHAIAIVLDGVTMSANQSVSVLSSSTFRIGIVTFVKQAQVGDNYEISPNLPDMSQLDYVKFVLAFYGAGLVIGADGGLHAVTLESVVAKCGTADVYDWSELVVNMSTDTPGTIEPKVEGYDSRRNWMRWAEDDKLANIDADGYIPAVGESLGAESDIYTAPFSATDGAHILQYETDEEGNVSDTDISARFVHVEQGQDGPELFFSGRQRWSRVIDEHYSSIREMLKEPRTLETYVRLKEVDLATLDFTRPVYLEQTGRHYILSKLKTDASTDICTAILVQLPE